MQESGLVLILGAKIRHNLGRLKTTREESKLKIAVIIGFIFCYLIGGYFMMIEAFGFVTTFSMIGNVLIDRIFYLYFFFLFAMLTLSAFVITLSTVFSSSETEYLMLLPVSTEKVLFVKFLEVTYLASWAFCFLSLPILMAYGTTKDMNQFGFLSKSLVLIFPFVVLCASLGFSLGILIVRFLFNRFGLLLLGIGLILGGLEIIDTWQTRNTFVHENISLALNQLLKHTWWSIHPWMPSSWFARFFLLIGKEPIHHYPYLTQLLAATLFLALTIMMTVNRIHGFSAWSEYRSLGSRKKKISIFKTIQKGIGVCFPKHSAQISLVAKDIQIFSRDPVQVMQFLIFFGLLAFYIVNLKNMRYDITLPFWRNLITHLNLGSVCLILATLATRFLFPGISLEGKAIWILSFSPLSTREIVLVKYGVAASIAIGITLPLTLLSNHMLQISGISGCFSVITATTSGITLAALSIGLGALFPNFDATHAQAIVSGFGGTLTLVLSLIYISFMVGIPGIIGHLTVVKVFSESSGLWMQGGATALLSIGSFGISWVILNKGIEHLSRIEI